MVGRRQIGRELALLALALAAPAAAQGPPGGMGMPPEMRQMFEQTKQKREMREQLRALTQVDRTKATALTPAQAKQLLAILKPWTTKPKMSEADAKAISAAVTRVLTASQRAALAKVPPRRFGPPGRGPGGPGGPPPGGFGGPPPGGPGGPPPGGPGGPGGPPPGGFDPARFAARMRAANFLSTKVEPNNPMSARRAEENKELVSMLEKRARSAATGGKRSGGWKLYRPRGWGRATYRLA